MKMIEMIVYFLSFCFDETVVRTQFININPLFDWLNALLRLSDMSLIG